jgi:hypothetical protein
MLQIVRSCNVLAKELSEYRNINTCNIMQQSSKYSNKGALKHNQHLLRAGNTTINALIYHNSPENTSMNEKTKQINI